MNSIDPDTLTRRLMNNQTFYLDICGYGFYAEPDNIPRQDPLLIEKFNPTKSSLLKTTIKKNNIASDHKSVFSLNSNPGSKKSIYLDFDGEKIENTAWNRNFNSGLAWVALGFSLDSNHSSFSNLELEVIQSVWQRVSEDFVGFDVNVTTQEPAFGALERSNLDDEIYGTRALISNDAVIYNSCKCSGLAYVGVFSSIGDLHRVNQPAWIFTQGAGSNPKFLAEAVTHEVGHTLGLSHDGSSLSPYFLGTAGWAPIMGVSFYQPITQWSRGEYLDATNSEDDLAIIASHGLKNRDDEDKDNEQSARKIEENQSLSGVIATSSDKDFFKFQVTSSGTFRLIAEPAVLGPNLDINLTVYQEGKEDERVVINPRLKIISIDILDGLSARASIFFKKGETYIFVIDNEDSLEESSSPYTTYASIGSYKLTISNKGL